MVARPGGRGYTFLAQELLAGAEFAKKDEWEPMCASH
jgi:hypothetical protein